MSHEFLSPGWIDAMDAAARSQPELADALAQPLVIQDEVVDGQGSSVHHVRIGGGEAFVQAGPAPDGPSVVRIRQDRATATAIAAGELSAQRAFMTGRLQIGGDLAALLEHAEALALLSDVFAAVRRQTVHPDDSTSASPTTGAADA